MRFGPDSAAGAFARIDIARWSAIVRDSAEFRLAARWTHVAVRLVADEAAIDLVVGPEGIAAGPPRDAEEVVLLSGSNRAWCDFLEETPRPPNHSVLGMDRRRADFAIAGGRSQLIRHLRVLTIVLDAMREAAVAAPRAAA